MRGYLVLLLLISTSLLRAQELPSEFIPADVHYFHNLKDWRDVCMENFGDYLYTRNINGDPHVVYGESKTKFGKLVSATIVQVNMKEGGDGNGAILKILCDCNEARFRITSVQEFNLSVSGKPIESKEIKWMYGRPGNMAGVYIHYACN